MHSDVEAQVIWRRWGAARRYW